MNNLIFIELTFLVLLTFYFTLHSTTYLIAQANVPAFCNESPGSKWAGYMSWIKPNAPVANGLVLTVQRYNLPNMILKPENILANNNKLSSFGAVSFIISERIGNSCLVEKNISLKNPLNCVSQLISISALFGQGGNPAPSAGYIKLDGNLFKYKASSGDLHSFKREGVDDLLLVHINKTQVH